MEPSLPFLRAGLPLFCSGVLFGETQLKVDAKILFISLRPLQYDLGNVFQDLNFDKNFVSSECFLRNHV